MGRTKKHRIFIFKIIYTYIYIYNWKFGNKNKNLEQEEDKECCAPFIEWFCRFGRLSDCLKQKFFVVVVVSKVFIKSFGGLQI